MRKGGGMVARSLHFACGPHCSVRGAVLIQGPAGACSIPKHWYKGKKDAMKRRREGFDEPASTDAGLHGIRGLHRRCPEHFSVECSGEKAADFSLPQDAPHGCLIVCVMEFGPARKLKETGGIPIVCG